MKKPICAFACISLLPFLAGGCKGDLVCDHPSYFQALRPYEGAGVAPFSIERLGPEMKSADLERMPAALTLKSFNAVRVDWGSRGHIAGHSDLAYSPAEGLARLQILELDDVYPMRRFSDGGSERVRFGFRSATCPVVTKYGDCEYRKDKLLLVAEMTCHPEASPTR